MLDVHAVFPMMVDLFLALQYCIYALRMSWSSIATYHDVSWSKPQSHAFQHQSFQTVRKLFQQISAHKNYNLGQKHQMP
jgi:hypothetical protein